MKKNGIFNLIYYKFNLPFLNVLKPEFHIE